MHLYCFQVFHLRALDEVERQRWVTALELAKARAIKNLEGTIRFALKVAARCNLPPDLKNLKSVFRELLVSTVARRSDSLLLGNRDPLSLGSNDPCC